MLLFCVVNGSAFADYVDFDLSGVFKVFFNLLNYLASNDNHLLVANLLGLDHNADFTSCLNCKGLFNAVKAVSDFLELLESLDVVFKIFTSCTGTCGGNCVSRLNDNRNNGLRLNVAVMRLDCVENLVVLLVFFSKVNSKLNV